MAEVHETDNYFSENCKNIGIRQIMALKDVKSKKKSLFTFVISPADTISDVTTKLEEWKSDIKYESAKEAITSAQQIFSQYSRVPDNGLIIYTGIVYTDDGVKDVKIVFEPFKCIYIPSNRILDTFDIEPLTRLLAFNYREYSLDQYKKERHEGERYLLRKLFDEKKSVYGVDTWKRLGDVKILFVCENLDINCYRLKNTRTGEVVTKHLNKEQENDKSNFQDFYWRRLQNDELQILEKTPLLDWLAQVHQDKLFGYKLEFVSDTTREGSKFRKLGGIGGILRDDVNIQAHGWVRSFVLFLVGLAISLVTMSLFKLMMDK